MFDLEKAIKHWKQSLKQSSVFEEGQIKEMETHLYEEVDHFVEQGDSLEVAFHKAVKKFGEVGKLGDEVYKTKKKHAHEILSQKQKTYILSMIPNFFKVAFRNIWRYKGHSFINITGLSIGLACCFLIVAYINFEFSFDEFHSDKEELYRVISYSSKNEFTSTSTLTPPAFAIDWPIQFPEIEEAIRYTQGANSFVKYEDEILPQSTFSYADANFLTVFDFELDEGNPETALISPMSVIIPKSVAQSFFPEGEVIGKTVYLKNEHPLVITGVFKDLPSNTHFKFDYLISLNSYPTTYGDFYSDLPDMLNNYLMYNFNTYLKLKEDSDNIELGKKIASYEKNRNGEAGNISVEYNLQSITDIHFAQGIQFDTASGNMQYIIIFSAIAILILLIAGFNFINLSTSKAVKRAKEVGLRKILGGNRKLLIIQFLGESLLFVLVSFVFSLLIMKLLLPAFSFYINPDLSFSFIDNIGLLISLAGVTLLFGLIAGYYPAFHLSSFQPLDAFNFRITNNNTALFRRILTVTQFAVASFLLISTFVVFNQMQYMKNSDPGFQKEQIAYFNTVDLSMELQSQYEPFRESLLQSASIQDVSRSDELPGFARSTYNYLVRQDGQQEIVSIRSLIVDPHFLDVFELELIEGRNFSKEIQTDINQAYIVNEAALNKYNFSTQNTNLWAIDGRPRELGDIIGVVKNFNFDGLQDDIEPMVLRMLEGYSFTVSVKLSGGQISEGLHDIEEVWGEFFPGYPISIQFLDDSFDELYKTETKLGILLSAFSALTIFVACLGLIGLASFMAQQRAKEVGVRKVLGASIREIIFLLNKDFILVVLQGILISIPVAWFFVSNWQQQFAYRADLKINYFILTSLILLMLSIITVSYYSWKAAKVNPVKSLKTE